MSERDMVLPDGYSDVPAGKVAAVVTHLEMTERPAIANDPVGAWTLRRVEAPGLDWFRDLHRRIGDDWLWSSRLRMTDAQLAAMIRAPMVEIYALVEGGRDEGVLDLDFGKSSECEVRLFGVTAKLTGSGAGRWLMNRALQLIWSRPVNRVWLHTCSLDHPAALAFYRRAGFRPFRRQIEISDDPRLDGTVPRSAAPHVPIIE
jgi:GNAT superfamily N-acetyltransferase